MRVDRLTRLLELGDRLQSRGITIPFTPAADEHDRANGESPWLLHALMRDEAAGGVDAEAEVMARLAAVFVRAHGGAARR